MENIIKRSGEFLLSEGIFLIITGIVMLYLAKTATLLLAFILSVGLLFIGLYRFINSIVMRKEISSPFLSVMSGIFLAVIGLYLIYHPLFNIMILTIAAALYFIIESINSFSLAVSNGGFKKVFWISLFTGIIQLILAIIIILGLPYNSLWFIGMLIGVNFIFSGITNISGYFHLKQLMSELNH